MKESAAKIRETILELASEDYYGLWEIYWKAQEILSETERSLRDVLRTELERLEREGLVTFYVRHRPEDDPVGIDADEVDWSTVLTPRPPERGAPQLLVAASGDAPRD